MKTLTLQEVKQNKDAEIAKDIARIDAVRDALSTAQKELNNAESRFQMQLSERQVIWAKAEEEAHIRIDTLKKEIADLEKQKKILQIPIDAEKERTHNLFIAADATLTSAQKKEALAEEKRRKSEEQAGILQDRLDEVSLREADVTEKEKQIKVRELALTEERQLLKNLSLELSNKLNSL